MVKRYKSVLKNGVKQQSIQFEQTNVRLHEIVVVSGFVSSSTVFVASALSNGRICCANRSKKANVLARSNPSTTAALLSATRLRHSWQTNVGGNFSLGNCGSSVVSSPCKRWLTIWIYTRYIFILVYNSFFVCDSSTLIIWIWLLGQQNNTKTKTAPPPSSSQFRPQYISFIVK